MNIFRFGIKNAVWAMLAVVLVGCAVETAQPVLPPETKPLGNFKLGLLVVFADKAEKGPMSRDATAAELKAPMEAEMRRRFGSIAGDKFYNISVAIDAYALAKPGIPLIASPKSALVVSLNVWDDAKKQIITEENKRFTIIEKISGRSIMGSGSSMSAEQQIDELVFIAAGQIEDYLRENESLFQAK